MKAIYKITTIALIFTLIGVVLWQSFAYASDKSYLRVPIYVDENREKEILKTLITSPIRNKAKKLLLGFIIHKFGGVVNIATMALSSLTYLLEVPKEERLINICVENGIRWYDWINENLGEVYKSGKTDFEIEDILLQTKENITSTYIVLAELKEALEEGLFESNKRKKSKVIRLIEDIEKEMTNLLGLIEDISSLSTIDDINTIIDYYAANIKTSGKRIKTKLSKEALILDKVVEDESLIVLGIIDNLFVNAERSKEKPDIVIRTSMKDKQAKIRFSDTGSGITKRILPKIFDKNFTTKNLEKGEKAGQGLYLTLEYLKLRGGTIQVDTVSKDGIPLRLTFDDKLEKMEIMPSDKKETGTTFTITLPLVSNQRAEAVFPIDGTELPGFKGFVFKKGTTYGSKWDWMEEVSYKEANYPEGITNVDFHTGLDVLEYETTVGRVLIEEGTPIKAAVSGKVILGKGEYKDVVVIKSQKGQLFMYNHILALVEPGTEVKAGDIIGKFRVFRFPPSSPYKDPIPHLHLEVLEGDFDFPVQIGDSRTKHEELWWYIDGFRSTHSVDPFLIWPNLLKDSTTEKDDTLLSLESLKKIKTQL